MSESVPIVVAHVIQQAVAPVFLLTGVGAILNVLTNRLSRIVDRWRALEQRHAGVPAEPQKLAGVRGELHLLGRRRTWIYRAITLCTLCALLVCVVIATLFLGTEFAVDPSRTVAMLFVAAMLSLILGLLCFLREISLAIAGAR
jgi:hypothetical protein